MGIGEDEELGDAISVTVVATGFAADQQSSITNTETKKIVHTLEDDQKATYEFKEEKVIVKSPVIDEPIAKKEEKIIHVLDDSEDEEPIMSAPKPSEVETISSPKHSEGENLIPTSEYINNLDVEYEEVTIEDVSEEDFVITEVAPKVEEAPAMEQEEASGDLLFDLPLNPKKEEAQPTKTLFTLTDDVLEIKAEEPVQMMTKDTSMESAPEVVETRFVLEDFDAEPTISKSSSIERNSGDSTGSDNEDEAAFQFELKSSASEVDVNDIETESEEVSPLSLTIAQLQERAEERRQKMKGFNYKFTDQVNKNIDEIEKQPAYKRLGVDLNDSNATKSKTKTALSKDSDDDIQLRSNNSFLHDNVD